MSRLTDQACMAIRKPGRYGDGNTLYLCVTRTGSRSWVQRLTVLGRRRDIGLGGFPRVRVEEARAKAAQNIHAARNGHELVTDRQRRLKRPTFEEAARRVHAVYRPRWTNEAHARGWIQTLQRHAFPHLAGMRVDRIREHDVLAVLEPIWAELPETARRVRQRVCTILAWCQAYGYTDRNAAGPQIDGALPRMPAVKERMRSLPHEEVAEALETIDGNDAVPRVAASCLRLVVLTASRGVEARQAVWREFDLDRAVWRVPAERMKVRREHRVPLSAQAVRLLRAARWLPGSSADGLVFPSTPSAERPLGAAAMMNALHASGYGERATVHGFRSSFRDWCAESGKSRDIAERALAHSVHGSEGAYFRSDLFDLRRGLMQEWADYILPAPSASDTHYLPSARERKGVEREFMNRLSEAGRARAQG